jgi:hypothetical protein
MVKISRAGRLRGGERRRVMSVWAATAVALFVLTGWAAAQTGGQGALEGTVTDPTGAVVGGATVTATNQASSVATTRTASSAGLYEITPLIPGVYTVTVKAKGFQTFAQQNIQVNGLNVTGFNTTLQVGSADQTVTVTDAPPELQTTNATLGGVITNQTYESLPLIMNNQQRDPTSFATLAPGAQAGARAPIMSGTGNYLAEVYVDGIPTTTSNQQGDNRVVSNGIPVESVDQLQVVSNGPSAEYQGAGAIGFTTKSGGDKYHGTVLDLVRNTIFDTWGFAGTYPPVKTIVNGVTTSTPGTKPIEHQNELSASVGGPIPLTRKKGFFFVNYDRYHGRQGVTPGIFTVPTAQMKMGDFSQLLQTINLPANCGGTGPVCVPTLVGQIYDPLTTATCTAHNLGGAPCRYQYGYGPGGGVGPNGNPVLTGTPNVIPASEISGISQYQQGFLPDPELNQVTSNTQYGGISGYDNHEFVFKVDFDATQSQRYSFFYSHGVRQSVGYGANLPVPYAAADSSDISPTIMIFEHSITLTPHMVNQFKYGFSRFPQPVFAPTAGLAPYRGGPDVGIGGLPPGQASGNFPGSSFATNVLFPTAISPWTEGGAADASHNVVPNAFTLVDNLQWSKGQHNVTFGIQMQWLQDNTTAQSTPSGIYTQAFSPNSTANFTGTSINSQYTGYSYASFLIGAVNSGATSVPLFTETGGRYHPVSPYVQDDWKIRPNLTLNLGLRYDYLPPFHESEDRFSFFNPKATNPLTNSPGELEFAGNRGSDISCQCRTPVQTYWKNWGPRAGFAWSVDEKTVFRGGFALAYSRAGGVGGRGGDSTGTGQNGFGANIVLPSATTSGVAAGPSYYLNNSSAFQAAGLANTNFGGPGYVIPAPSTPNAAALTLGTGNYVSGGKYVTPGGAPAYADPYLSGRAPEFEFYNFGMQRALTNSLTVMVNYSGSQSHFVAGAGVPGFWSGQIDPAIVAATGSVLASDNATNILNAPATPANVAIAQANGINIPAWYAAAGAVSTVPTIGRAVRPFPQYSSPPAPEWDNIANISYNSVQISLAQRQYKGLSYTVNYTYSRNIGDDGTSRSAFPVPAAASSNGVAIAGNNRADRDLVATDTPQILNIYGLDQLPFGKGHIGGDNFLVRTLASGWSVSGIFTYDSGNPMLVVGSGCTTPSSGTCMPDLVPGRANNIRINGGYSGHGVTAQNYNTVRYLDPTAFTLPNVFPLPANAIQCPVPPGSCTPPVPVTKIGDAPRSSLNLWSPSHYNLDMSVRRSFNLSPERVKFEFDADCFDVTNKVTFNFGSSNTQTWSTASTSNFGELQGYSGNRRFQFGGRITF